MLIRYPVHTSFVLLVIFEQVVDSNLNANKIGLVCIA